MVDGADVAILKNVRAGMTELDVYCGVSAACIQGAGQPVIVYGDFAVSPGPERAPVSGSCTSSSTSPRARPSVSRARSTGSSGPEVVTVGASVDP